MTIKEMKDFFVQERLGSYYQMHDKQCKTDYLLDFGIILRVFDTFKNLRLKKI